MTDIMQKANLPTDTIAEVLEIEYKLKQNGNWSRITTLAEEIMRELPGEKELRAKLQQAESWEEELGVHKYTLAMFVLLNCWQILETRYEEQNLPEDIFLNSLDDMRCKLYECREVYGVNGNFVGFWYDRFFDMTRFGLGRLQFELETFPYDKPYTENGIMVRKGDPVINMHIPSSGPLHKKDVDASLNRAAEFFKEHFPNGNVVFVVDSWLVDPDLVSLLPEGNMKDFAKRFTTIHTRKFDEFLDGWRVFGPEWEKAPSELPRRTKLQKAIAEYLEQGGKLGEGYGIFMWR